MHYVISHWFNMDEAITSIYVEANASVRMGDSTTTVYINDALVDMGGTVSKIVSPTGETIYSAY